MVLLVSLLDANNELENVLFELSRRYDQLFKRCAPHKRYFLGSYDRFN
jgi:hypothetical protein